MLISCVHFNKVFKTSWATGAEWWFIIIYCRRHRHHYLLQLYTSCFVHSIGANFFGGFEVRLTERALFGRILREKKKIPNETCYWYSWHCFASAAVCDSHRDDENEYECRYGVTTLNRFFCLFLHPNIFKMDDDDDDDLCVCLSVLSSTVHPNAFDNLPATHTRTPDTAVSSGSFFHSIAYR